MAAEVEQPRPAADDHRKHEQSELVDQPGGDQRVDELDAAGRDDVTTRRVPERLHLVDDRSAQDG